ncbi:MULTISPECIES: TetR-like C-terminal domain-containing protein [unclassified Bacillus (in: firmicutes)]|uniref:TetR-like C-terminal domain-containing protein n=1 Tax=unclassified Bacillus (in: firmicutes) TaxID=185979 RepID=UPI0033656902
MYAIYPALTGSKGAPYFRSRFLEFVIEELKDEVNVNEGKNQGLNKDVIIQFLGVAIIGIVESYFTNELNEPSRVVAEQVGILLERNL